MKKEEKKQKVLKAAADCFARYGYDKTTLEDIGKAVGLNKASLYYYYKNKENIFCDVILQEAELFMQELQKKVKAARTYESRILNYMTERLNYYKNIVNLHNLSLDTIRKVEPIFNDVYDMVLQKETAFVAAMLREGQESGEFQKADVQRIAHILLEIAIAIRYKSIHTSNARMDADADYAGILEDTRMASKLILKGLKTAQA